MSHFSYENIHCKKIFGENFNKKEYISHNRVSTNIIDDMIDNIWQTSPDN